MKREIDLSSIEFEVRDGPWGTSVGKMLGWQWVFKDIFENALIRFDATLPTLDWSKPQTSKSLYNDPDWPEKKLVRRFAIGRCLRFFADRELLPLRCINPRATGTKKYVRVNPLIVSDDHDSGQAVVAAEGETSNRNQGVTNRTPAAMEI